MRALQLAVLATLLIALASCGLTMGQQNRALAVLEELRASGAITGEQLNAMREAILGAGFGGWLETIGGSLGGAALAYFGVRLDRGAPERVRQLARSGADPYRGAPTP